MSDSPGTPGLAADVDPLTVFDPARREPDLRAMTRIVLRPIGSPMPLGFFTVAIDSVLVSALQWGLRPAADERAVALIVFPAFVVQVIVGIFAFGARDSIAATLMMSFATTWLVDALIFYVNPPGAANAVGFLLAAVALYTAFALLMEDSRGREVLPIGRLGMAHHATHGGLAMQLRDIERQAGVRRTL
jgi:hypothetical protein